MKLSFNLAILSSINIALIFLFQFYILSFMGPGEETDALFAGMTLPQLVVAIVSGSLMHVLVPILSGKDESELLTSAWSFIFLVSVLFGALAVFLFIISPLWVALTLPGLSDASKDLTVNLMRIQLIGIIFSAINGVQWGAYHAQQKFFWSEISLGIASGISFLLLVIFLPIKGIEAAAWISTLRLGVQTILLGAGLGRPRYPDLNSSSIKLAWIRIKPLLLGTAYYKTDPVIDRFLLSSAIPGSISIYYLAQQIYSAGGTVVNKAIISPLVPKLSRFYARKDKEEFVKLLKKSMLFVLLVTAIGFISIIFVGRDVLESIKAFPSLDNNSLDVLWVLLILMSGKFIIGSLGMVITSAFYSIGNTKVPTIVGSIAYTLGILIKIAMYLGFGLNGLAVGVSLYYAISFLLMAMKFYEKKIF